MRKTAKILRNVHGKGWLLACLLSFFCVLLATGQERGRVQGLILESGKSQRIANANIKNLNSKEVTASDEIGEFSILASIGDSLEVSKVGFKTIRTEIKTFSDILLDLSPTSVRIDDVTVTSPNRQAEMQDVMDSYRRKGIYQEGKPSVLGYIFNPLTSLYERFSRTGKQARRFKNYMNLEYEASVVNRLFNEYRVMQLTGYTGEDLDNFMLLHRPNYEQAQNWGEYDIIKYIKDSSKQFEKDGRPQAPRLPKLEIPPIS